MTDTIELLEAIGRDASLRHAEAGELLGLLEPAQASAELLLAVRLGDGEPLRRGQREQQPPQVSQTPVHDPGHAPDENEDDEDDAPLLPDQRQAMHAGSGATQAEAT